MGVVAGTSHVVERVGRIGSCPMVGGAHIDGIGAMVNGSDGDFGVTGGRQQFYEGRLGHEVVVWAAA